MKISQLAAYRETLDDMDLPSEAPLRHEIAEVIDFVGNRTAQLPQHLIDLISYQSQTLAGIQQFRDTMAEIKAEILRQIQALEPEYLARSYRLYEDGLNSDSVDYVLDRVIPISEETKTFIQSRVQAHSNWHYAGLLIRPGREAWIEHMVACDPLYVIDTSHDLFGPAKTRFNELYQNRLRYYVIKESTTDPMMWQLPAGQFGFCLAYNFFHYKPFEIMRSYLTEIYQKLRPGGIVGMTFNDCDRRGAVELAENMYTCYTPGRMVIALCENVGFVIEKNYQLDAAVNWIEMRRPGEMITLRGGQSLAKIVAKSK